MPETLQELHQTPRVLVAVAKKVASELGLRFRRQLGPLEQQPLELEAGRLAVADRQGVVAEFGHHGRQDALEAPLPRGLLASLREALEKSTIPNRVDVVDLAKTDAAFRDRIRREGIRWIASGSA